MTNQPLSDLVATHYHNWPYPEPIFDIPGWLVDHWQWFDPSHAYRLFWPNQGAYLPDCEILVAGCGNNQAAVLAYTNPLARIVAIEVSQPSLEHHRWLKDQYGLNNLELFHLPIEEINALGRQFDLIVSTGVLHHLESPEVGLSALAQCLKPNGVVAIMLYARYGRHGVEVMQSVFRDLGLAQNQESLFLVKDVIASLPETHPLKPYMGKASDLAADTGWIDTFLHGRDRSYTVRDCLDLVEEAGLAFQDWFLKSDYYPPLLNKTGFFGVVSELDEVSQWSIMERINTQNACHFVTACRKDRPRESYKVDFSAPRILSGIPDFRYRCGLDDEELFRSDWRSTLNPAQLALIQRIDGIKSMGTIIKEANADDALAGFSESEFRDVALQFFQSLWQGDFISIGLSE